MFLSNLIKSGKVIDLGIPVNVGVTYAFDSSKNLIKEKNAIIKSAIPMSDENTEGTTSGLQINSICNVPQENMPQYVQDAKKSIDEYYQTEMQRAYEEGLKKAEQEAMNMIEEAKAERERILEEVISLKEGLKAEYQEELKNTEKELLDLSLNIAEKIINYEVEKSDNYVLGIVKDALDKVMSKKDVIVKLSTADYYTVLSNKKYLMANVKGFGEVDLVQDESMEPGSLIIDTPLGVIDGSIQVRMDNIQKVITSILNEE
jgi:flagellar assembly protein FliH